MSTRRKGPTTTLLAFTLVLTAATWATAGVTSIVLNSEPGDYIGGAGSFSCTLRATAHFSPKQTETSSVCISTRRPSTTGGRLQGGH